MLRGRIVGGPRAEQAGVPADAPLVAARTVDLTFAALAGWLMLGVYLDAWAHGAHLPDSFWTPWHGILYSGLVACAAFLVGASLVEGRTARRILAPGYGLSLVGAAVAGLGGIADAIWHTLFGIEFDIDAAVSASHLVIVAGIFLLVSGPARAAWASRSRIGVPGALSLLYALSILTVILSYANPFAGLMGTGPAPSSAALGQLEQIPRCSRCATAPSLLRCSRSWSGATPSRWSSTAARASATRSG